MRAWRRAGIAHLNSWWAMPTLRLLGGSVATAFFAAERRSYLAIFLLFAPRRQLVWNEGVLRILAGKSA
jgi:hypothetical protein